jgi:[acyl-carrier-protein] S-malonyltransferase
MKTAIVFPGQGSQYPGMGKGVAQEYKAAADCFARISDAVGLDVAKLCFEGTEEELRRTDNTQIAIFATSMAIFAALRQTGLHFDGAAGHSLGEYSALCSLGVFDLESASRLVRRRGVLMEEARAGAMHAMAAVIGLDNEVVASVCAEETEGCCAVANYNSPSQTIISGDAAAVERTADKLKARGAKRVIPLNVGAAFHSPLMESAKQKMAEVLSQVHFGSPTGDFIPNATGTVTRNPDEIRENLMQQIKSPVRWQQTVESFLEAGYSNFIEIGPKKVLTGLIKQCSETAVCWNVEDAEQIAELVACV